MTPVFILEMDRSETVDPDDRHYVFERDLPVETPFFHVYEVRECELAEELMDRMLRAETDGQTELEAAFRAGKPVYSSARPSTDSHMETP